LIAPDAYPKLLKKDLFGEIHLCREGEVLWVLRDLNTTKPWIRGVSRWLLRREATALAALDDIDGVPKLLRLDQNSLARSYIAGLPMHLARPTDQGYFDAAARLSRRIHRAGVVHNDLAKEPNILVDQQGAPAFIDFQLAWFSPRRGRLFRLLGREDIRHVLKHKRSYCGAFLTRREQDILAHPSFLSIVWMKTVKPLYLFVTRRILHWSDREGAADRGTGRDTAPRHDPDRGHSRTMPLERDKTSAGNQEW